MRKFVGSTLGINAHEGRKKTFLRKDKWNCGAVLKKVSVAITQGSVELGWPFNTHLAKDLGFDSSPTPTINKSLGGCSLQRGGLSLDKAVLFNGWQLPGRDLVLNCQ